MVYPACRCGSGKCRCRDFFFIMAEGSWWAACASCLCAVCICSCRNSSAQPCLSCRILRCQCKHKHTEHDPVSKACMKAACRCEGFHSPWHCNCNHPWAEHTQVGRMVFPMALAAMCAMYWTRACVSVRSVTYLQLLAEKQVQSLASMLARLQVAPKHAALAVADTAAGHDMAGWDHVKRGQEND